MIHLCARAVVPEELLGPPLAFLLCKAVTYSLFLNTLTAVPPSFTQDLEKPVVPKGGIAEPWGPSERVQWPLTVLLRMVKMAPELC